MTASARVRAQAKINLVLRVLAREASGYHSIETLFSRIDLADDVCVRVAPGRSVDCAGPAMPAGGLGPTERNLAFRAAALYAQETGWPGGFAVEIVKRIPVGGGLGGGSADAGAVLRALDALSPNPLGRRLVELAGGLGADVPFLAAESPMALAWGRGERLFPLRPLDSRTTMLVVPDFAVATVDAYAWLAAGRGEYVATASVLDPEMLGTWEGIAAIAVNDFAPVVARRRPAIAESLDALRSLEPIVALLAGSGSGMFAVFDAAPDPASVVRATGMTVIPTCTSERVERVELVSAAN